LGNLCAQIRADLERRRVALSASIRSYPTPIARCDEQLAALLESRAQVLRLLACGDAELLEAFAAAAGRWDDAAAARLRAKAERAIAA
jgi:hypothetical protein